MALQGFLNIPNVGGESRIDEHEGEIEVHGVHWKVEQASYDPRGGRLRGGAIVSAFTAQKFFDAASVYLAKAVAHGIRFDEITFVARAMNDDMGQPLDYLTITMTNCSLILAEDQHESHDPNDQRIHETVAIVFELFRINYVQVNPDGSETEHEAEYGGAGRRI